MKTNKYLLYLVLCPVVLLLAACEPRGLKEQDVFTDEASLEEILKQENPVYGYKIFTLNEFLDKFMTEKGSYVTDTTPYRERSYDATHDLYMYSVDTIKTDTLGIYIRGRVTTDDYAGNFYKAMVIQQVINGEQQNLRISVDLGSSGGMYQMGQEIIIRCNGLAIGRYANQPQLCIPAYNNNIFAMNASQKVGWGPGRIQGSLFRRATRMLGTPDVSKLKYDTLSLTELYSQIPLKPTPDAAGMDMVRKQDGRLVVIRNVSFTGEFNDNGKLDFCDTQHPDSSENANVFAPTTKNLNYPQSRALKAGTNRIMCSCSEYAKFAYFYLPGADKNGVTECTNWKGTVTGILGWYQDKGSELASGNLTGYEWSVTPRGIPGIGVPDIYMYNEQDDAVWVPQEFDPKDYLPAAQQ